jgi:hypothetical protein
VMRWCHDSRVSRHPRRIRIRLLFRLLSLSLPLLPITLLISYDKLR